jgi:hypothetical protein
MNSFQQGARAIITIASPLAAICETVFTNLYLNVSPKMIERRFAIGAKPLKIKMKSARLFVSMKTLRKIMN